MAHDHLSLFEADLRWQAQTVDFPSAEYFTGHYSNACLNSETIVTPLCHHPAPPRISQMNRPLNSDELGAKGEQKFGELCLDARLKPNQPNRDRVGWDYVVTWPLLEASPLDSRPANSLAGQRHHLAEYRHA